MIIKSNLQIWGVDFEVGACWDAGSTPPHVAREKSGRWIVKRETERFIVCFVHTIGGKEDLLNIFPSSEQGEIDAKTFALAAYQKH